MAEDPKTANAVGNNAVGKHTQTKMQQKNFSRISSCFLHHFFTFFHTFENSGALDTSLKATRAARGPMLGGGP